MKFKKLVKKAIPHRLFDAIEPTGHLAEAFVYNLLAGFPAKGMKVIGVTGTNGKTTTCFMIHKMLSEAGIRTGIMTTVGVGVENVETQAEHVTNVAPKEFVKRIKQLKAQNIEWLVLETTSHALAQHRVFGVDYSVAVLTNITHEHLDYHKTFERYRQAKLKLFKRTNSYKKGLRLGVVNAEDPSASVFAAELANPVTYGIDKGDAQAKNVQLSPQGAEYSAEYRGSKYSIKTNLPGKFNVYNSLATVVVGAELGLTPQQVEQGIAALGGVDGRMNRIDEGQDFDVIVDFAHTPDSFEKLFKDFKQFGKGKLIVVFGSAGRRDEAKRAVQGELAGKYCDEVVITEEDDRDEDGNAILEQIAEGAKKSGKTQDKDLFLVHNRQEAINFAIDRAQKGDTVLLLGKGHEHTIERAHGTDLWDEVATTRQAIAQR